MSERFKTSVAAIAKHFIHQAMLGRHLTHTDFPEVSDRDWDLILREVNRRIQPPAHSTWTLAYDFLARRAGKEI